jgi:hypothetical protein
MPLINLQTNLKSLKYGSDRPGGGDSGLPYIQTKIDDNPAKLLGRFDDGLIRGGIVGAAKASAIDTKRIFKFLKDVPQGPLFITRQVGLQLSNPRLEVKNQTLDSAISGLLQPTRIYNLGLNTLAQVPVNAFGIHFNRHGLLPIQSENTKYESVVRNNAGLINNSVDTAEKYNRLVKLTSKFGLGNNTNTNTETNDIINKYIGGPESVYGIGSTIIKRTTYTGYSAKIKDAIKDSENYAGYSRIAEPGKPVNYVKALGNKNDFRSIFNYNSEVEIYSDPVEVKKGVNNTAIEYGNFKRYSDIIKQTKTELTQSIGAGTGLNNKTSGSFITIDLTSKGLNRDATDFRYITGSRLEAFNRTDDNVYPKITFKIIKPFGGEDLVNLSAYINGFRDGFNSTWNDINYAGRAESFYVYTKFKREVSFNLQLPCFNRDQLIKNHQDLNKLSSVTAGQYDGVLLGGVLIQLTVPNYIVGEYATLNSISYDMPDGATWDIDKQLSMFINVSFNFTIIHQNLPQLNSKLIAPNV